MRTPTVIYEALPNIYIFLAVLTAYKLPSALVSVVMFLAAAYLVKKWRTNNRNKRTVKRRLR